MQTFEGGLDQNGQPAPHCSVGAFVNNSAALLVFSLKSTTPNYYGFLKTMPPITDSEFELLIT
jgi:hypothetical protein